MVQLSHPYITTGKTIALTRWAFVGKVSLIFEYIYNIYGFLGSSAGKESACNAGDPGLIPGSEDPLEEGRTTHSRILGLPWWLRR